MSDVVVVAVISLCGTLGGSYLGVIRANALTNFRILKLEEKVDKHNNLIERMARVEQRINALEEER